MRRQQQRAEGSEKTLAAFQGGMAGFIAEAVGHLLIEAFSSSSYVELDACFKKRKI